MNKVRKETIKTGTFYREAHIELPKEQEEGSRTFEFSFSSEFKVERVYNGKLGMELLDHSEESVNLERMRSAPLLLNHDLNDQIGVVEAVSVADGQMRGAVRFSQSQHANEIMKDVEDGIRTGVSIGYSVKEVREEQEGGETIWRVVDWMPFEVSIVAVPADPEVGIGRANTEEFETQVELRDKPIIEIKESPKMEDKEINIKEIEEQAAKRGREEETNRVRGIAKQAKDFNVSPEMTEEAINSGETEDAFITRALKAQFGEDKVKPVSNTEAPSDFVGIKAKEVRAYSMMSAIRGLIENGRVEGMEKELSDDIAKKRGVSTSGFFVPFEVQNHRFMQAGTPALGGDIIQEDLLGGSFIDLLRNMTVLDKMGITRLDNLQGNVAIPRQDGGISANWLAEGATITAADQSLDQVLLTPKRLGAETQYTKQLLLQSSVGVENMIRNDIMKAIALATDAGGLEGDGTGGAPTGILNTSGISTVTFTTTATWAKVLEFESDIATDNAATGAMKWVTTAAVRGAWKNILKTSAVSGYLWEDTEVNGYDAMVSQQISGNKVFFGDWSSLIAATWGGMEILIDNLSLISSEKIKLVTNTYSDFGVRHPESFSVSTDAGNL